MVPSCWLLAPVAAGAPWERVDAEPWASTREWTNEVEIGDADGDGDLDVMLVNGGDYSNAGDDEPSRLFLGDGSGNFAEQAVPELIGLHRTAKIRDFDGDGTPDLFLPGAWQTASVLLLGDGAGGWIDASAGLPTDPLSVGDAEAGDVDDDGDLDLVLTDSGPGNALFGDGAFTRLWLNDGTGGFVDDTPARMPMVKIGWSWDLELADIDLDNDLDLAISCKTCDGSYLYENDGTGVYTNASAGLPQRTNNYDFEALDLTGDGLPDLVTINDGPGLDERILVNTGAGFADETATRLPPSANLGEDDNDAVLLDYDDDGDIDVLIGSLSGSDRVLVGEGGVFGVVEGVLQGPSTPGTLGVAVGDLDGDHKLDVVMGQGEAAFTDSWYRGVDVPADTQPPVVAVETLSGPLASPVVVHAMAHDRKTPVSPDDLVATVEWAADGGAGMGTVRMSHSGHTVWRARLDLPLAGGTTGTYRACATDRAGNTACTAYVAFTVDGGPTTTPPTDTDTDTGTGTPPTDTDTDTSSEDDPTGPDAGEVEDGHGGCGCGGAGPALGWPLAVGIAALTRRNRRRSAR